MKFDLTNYHAGWCDIGVRGVMIKSQKINFLNRIFCRKKMGFSLKKTQHPTYLLQEIVLFWELKLNINKVVRLI